MIIIEDKFYKNNLENLHNFEYEEWKDIEGFKGIYQVSNLGRIKSLKRKRVKKDRILKPAIKMNSDGRRTYFYVHLSNGRHRSVHYVHRLVAMAFIPNPKGYKYINHKDCDMLNNHYKNLEWCTQKHNVRHAFKNGLMKYDLIPEKEKQRRLDNRTRIETTRKEFYEIKEKYKSGRYTQYELADEYGKDQSAISRLLQRDHYWK